MKNILTFILVLLFMFVIAFLNSCGCNYHLKKVKSKCNFTQDTIFKTVSVEIPVSKTDTIFKEYFYSKDTVILREGKLTVKYFYNNRDSVVYLQGKCDPEIIKIKTPVVVNKYKQPFPWKWLITFVGFMAFCGLLARFLNNFVNKNNKL